MKYNQDVYYIIRIHSGLISSLVKDFYLKRRSKKVSKKVGCI